MVLLRYGLANQLLVRRTLTLGEKDNGSFLTCVASQPGTSSTFKSKKVSFRKDQQMEDFFKRYNNHRKTKKNILSPTQFEVDQRHGEFVKEGGESCEGRSEST